MIRYSYCCAAFSLLLIFSWQSLSAMGLFGNPEGLPVPGCTYPDALNYDPNATEDDGSCVFACSYGCTATGACNFSPMAQFDDGSCDFSCLGCTYPQAVNFNPAASLDDGSCQLQGCTDPAACNFEPFYNMSDGSCYYTCICPEDVNRDGYISVRDLLIMLASLGTIC